MPPPARRTHARARKRRLTAIAIAVTLALGGCVTGPKYQSPAKNEASRYQVRVPAGTDSEAGDTQHFVTGAKIQADWYTLFGSPALNGLIDTALAHNPTLHASLASLQEAKYEYEAISGTNLPNVDATAGISRQQGSGAQIGLDNPLFNNVFSLFTGRISLGYNFDLFGRSARETEAQAAKVSYRQNLLLASRLALVDNLVTTAIGYAALSDRLATMDRIIQTQQHQLKLLEGQQRAGAIALGEVLKARAQLADTLAQLPGLNHQMAVASHTLAKLAGADPGRFVAPTLSLRDFTLPAQLPVSVSSALVRQRPDIRAAEQLLHVANAQVGIATASLYPNIRITAGFGSAANHANDVLKAPSEVWNLGGDLVAPIFHGGTLRAQRKAARAQWQVQYAQYRQTVLSAFGQVADVLDAIVQDAASLKARELAVAANKQSLNLTERLYRAGAAPYQDVLAARQRYDTAIMSRIDASGRRYLDTATLYHALGGGWWNDPERSHPTNAAAR